MHVHTRSAYRWGERHMDPDVVRHNEEHPDRLLRQARPPYRAIPLSC